MPDEKKKLSHPLQEKGLGVGAPQNWNRWPAYGTLLRYYHEIRPRIRVHCEQIHCD